MAVAGAVWHQLTPIIKPRTDCCFPVVAGDGSSAETSGGLWFFKVIDLEGAGGALRVDVAQGALRVPGQGEELPRRREGLALELRGQAEVHDVQEAVAAARLANG